MNWNSYLATSRLRKSSVDGNGVFLDKRNHFESDYGRVIFSSACRRLHDKTQVFPLTSDDSIHSRLTHSMEVMNLGNSFALDLLEEKNFCNEETGIDRDTVLRIVAPILKTACLIHDIGNPPFGHFGEVVFQDYFERLFNGLRYCMTHKGTESSISTYIWNNINDGQKNEIENFLNDRKRHLDYTKFDGNAQGFRVLTKLQYAGDSYGLNLTKATLATSLKYPNCGKVDKDGPIGCHKHGVFTSEEPFLKNIADEIGLNYDTKKGYAFRHPLSFLVEAADSICYLTMDMEDANRKKWLGLHDVVKHILSKKNLVGNFRENLLNLIRSIERKNVTKSDWMKFRNMLISHMVGVAITNFTSYLDEICLGKYNNELIKDGDDTSTALDELSKSKIITQNDIVSLEVTGRSVIEGLFNSYITLLFHKNEKFREKGKSLIANSILRLIMHEHFEVQFRKGNEKPENDFQKMIAEKVEKEIVEFDVGELNVESRFRLIRDFVSGMTDKFALNHYQKLSGQHL